MTSWAERAKLHFSQECQKRSAKSDKTNIVFIQERQKPSAKTDKTPLLALLALPFEHSCKKRDFQNQGFDVANDQIITTGTRRSPDASPFLVAASIEYDRQLVEAGYSLQIPPEPIKIQDNNIKDNNEIPPRKLDHFHVNAPWRVLSKAYYAHQFNCLECISAGRGSRYGQRCDIGAALWTQYADREFKTDASSGRASP